LLQLAISTEDDEQLDSEVTLGAFAPCNSSSRDIVAASKPGSSRGLHRFGSSGDLLTMESAAEKEAMDSVADAAGFSNIAAGTAGAAAGPWQQPGHLQQQQQVAGYSSVASPAASTAFADAFEDPSSSKVQAGSAGSTGSMTGTSRPSLPLQQQQGEQEELRLSFMSEREVYAVIHVQLLPGCSDSSIASRAASAAAASSPFVQAAAAAAGTGTAAAAAASTAAASATPSVLVLGNHKAVLTAQEQQCLSAVGLLAGFLCGLGALLLHSSAGQLLVLAAAVLNAVCMVAAARPAWLHRALHYCRHSSRLKPSASLCVARSHGSSSRPGSGWAAAAGRQTPYGHSRTPSWDVGTAAVAAAHPNLSSVVAAGALHEQHPSAAAAADSGAIDVSAAGGLRLRLLYGGFMREALGLLEEQILAYRSMRERAVAAVAVQLAGAAHHMLLHHQFVSIQAIQLRLGRGVVACIAAWQAGSDSVVGNVELRCIGRMQRLLLAVSPQMYARLLLLKQN
jgi:hypothetical protein